MVLYRLILRISSRVTLLALRQSYSWPSASKATPKNTVKSFTWITRNYNHSEIKHNKTVHILGDLLHRCIVMPHLRQLKYPSCQADCFMVTGSVKGCLSMHCPSVHLVATKWSAWQFTCFIYPWARKKLNSGVLIHQLLFFSQCIHLKLTTQSSMFFLHWWTHFFASQVLQSHLIFIQTIPLCEIWALHLVVGLLWWPPSLWGGVCQCHVM